SLLGSLASISYLQFLRNPQVTRKLKIYCIFQVDDKWLRAVFSAHQTCGTVPRHISGLIGHKEASRFLSEVSVVPVTLWYSYGRNLTELTLRAQPTGGHQTRDTGSGDWWSGLFTDFGVMDYGTL
ncbi:hypothetical protein MJO28_017501, partial [Puccinia striiformis f. sp. tritici]